MTTALIRRPTFLVALFTTRYQPEEIPNASKATLKHWRLALRCLTRFLEREPTLDDLTETMLESCIRFYLDTGSSNTADVISAKVVALWRFAARLGLVSTWPRFPRPRVTAAGVSLPPKPPKPKRVRRRDRKRWRFEHPDPTGKPGWQLGKPREPVAKDPILIPAIFDTSTPLRALAALYVDRKLFAASQTTISHYETAIRILERLVKREPIVSDLTEENVIGVMRLTMRAGRVPQTANAYRAKLVALWNFACRRGLLKEWPDLKKLNEPRKIPFVWMPGQMELIFAAVKRQTWCIGDVPAPDWFTAFLLTMWDTTERLGALLQVRPCDLQGNWLVIPAEFRKWKREDKAHRLGSDTMDALQRIIAPGRPRIFPWPYSLSTLFARYRAILKEAGLATSRKAMFHAVRRTVASYYQQAGGDASQLLGHADPRTTRESYLSPLIVQVAQVSDLLPRPIGGAN